jgi:hypothetical protein
MTESPATLADHVRALLDPVRHTETYVLRSAIPGTGTPAIIRTHRVILPALLVQLKLAVEPSTAAERGARGYASSPAARVDAVDCLAGIDHDARWWHYVLTGRRTWAHLPDVLRRLVGLPAEQREARDLAKNADRWVTWAQTVTAWDEPPARPNIQCPECGWRGGIRLRVDPVTVVCVECRTTWRGDAEIAVLTKQLTWTRRQDDVAGTSTIVAS